MNTSEVGLYIRLLAYSWLTGGLPDDEVSLARLGRLEPGVQFPEIVKSKFKKCEDGLLRNYRMEEERAKQERNSQQQKANVLKRWHPEIPEAQAKFREAHKKTASDSHPKSPNGSTTAEQIYGCYPRKVGKPDALKAIAKALTKVDESVLRAAVEGFSKAWSGATLEDMKFCPHPATWFNSERYNDSPETWVRTDGQLTKTGKPSIYELKTILEAKEKLAKSIFDQHAFESATGTDWSSQEKREEHRVIKSEIKSLIKQISSTTTTP